MSAHVQDRTALYEEIIRLRSVCAEAYQLAGFYDADVKALDNLIAAANGEPLPHESFLPIVGDIGDFTHEKHPYRAVCTQFTGENQEEILKLLNDERTYATVFDLTNIMVRFSKPSEGQRAIDTISAGWWVVKGENGATKCYDDATFRTKYQEIK